MSAMLYFISLLGWALLIKVFIPRLNLGISIFCGYLCELLFSYITILILGIFYPGAYFIIYGGFVSLIAAVIIGHNKIAKKQISFSRSDIFIIFTYFILSTCFVIFLSDGTLKAHDAYSFWARAARELYVFNDGYINSQTNIAHWDYNPIFATLQYAITTVFGWSTKYLFFIIIGYFVTSLCAIIDAMKSGYIHKIVFLLLVILFYPVISTTYSTTFLGADGALALIFITAILYWYSQKQDGFSVTIPVILAATALPAIKLYSGLMLAVVLGVMLGASLIKNKNTGIKIGLIIAITGILFMQFSWSAYYNYNVDRAAYERRIETYAYQGIEKDISSEEPNFNISYFIKGNPRTEQLSSEVDKNNILEMFKLSRNSITLFITANLNNSFLHIYSIIVLTLLAYFYLIRSGEEAEKKRMLQTVICLWSAAIIYITGMFITYLVQPGTSHEPIRYIGVVIIPIVISVFFYICEYWKSNNKKISQSTQIALLITVLILLLGNNPTTIINAYSGKSALEFPAATYVQNILNTNLIKIQETLSDDERILIIDNKEDNVGLGASGVIYAYQYYMLPKRGKVLYYEYGNKDILEQLTVEYLERELIQNRIDTIAIIVDDEDICNKLSAILGIPIDTSIANYIDVKMYDGKFDYCIKSNF